MLLPKDYVRLRMTGEHVSEMSDASGTLWLDVAARDWSDSMLAATGLSRDHMPRLVEGSEPGGALRATVAVEWGVPAGVPVAGGAGDNAAAAVGIGAVAPGSGFLSARYIGRPVRLERRVLAESRTGGARVSAIASPARGTR